MTNKKTRLSVVLATRNEEENIARCLKSVRKIASEIIIFDEESTDNTRKIARSFGAKVFKVKHESNFHITKQKAIDKAKGDWILQMDADEVVTPKLAREIKRVLRSNNIELLGKNSKHHVLKNSKEKVYKLFQRHQKLIEKRDGKIGKKTGEVAAFFIPRVNIFMGKPLIHGGVYPDPAIRLIKRGKAKLPAKDVHEIMKVNGEVKWLYNAMEHHDSPTFKRYIERNNRYTDLFAEDYKKQKLPVNLSNTFKYLFLLPATDFLLLYLRHKAILDGYRGLIWSFFSALRFPISYVKYMKMSKT